MTFFLANSVMSYDLIISIHTLNSKLINKCAIFLYDCLYPKLKAILDKYGQIDIYKHI